MVVLSESGAEVNPSELDDLLPREVVHGNKLRLEGWIPYGQRATSLFKMIRSLRFQGSRTRRSKSSPATPTRRASLSRCLGGNSRTRSGEH